MICFSGGAKGADVLWGELAESLGHQVKHFSFAGHRCVATRNIHVLTETELAEAQVHLNQANKVLKRNPFPKSSNVRNLLRRNWFQVKDTDAVYAISKFEDGNVAGGTAWAVQMAIDRRVPWIFLFEQEENQWYRWMYGNDAWYQAIPRIPKDKWTGIGTRDINYNGQQAIREICQIGW